MDSVGLVGRRNAQGDRMNGGVRWRRKKTTELSEGFSLLLELFKGIMERDVGIFFFFFLFPSLL